MLQYVTFAEAYLYVHYESEGVSLYRIILFTSDQNYYTISHISKKGGVRYEASREA